MTHPMPAYERALLYGLWCALLIECGGRGGIVQGETDATQINIASKVPGRVDSIYVREGDMVRRGQLLATLDGAEIRARAAQAHAA
jgi:hypothetical protein